MLSGLRCQGKWIFKRITLCERLKAIILLLHEDGVATLKWLQANLLAPFVRRNQRCADAITDRLVLGRSIHAQQPSRSNSVP
jgi:hypothetical protein